MILAKKTVVALLLVGSLSMTQAPTYLGASPQPQPSQVEAASNQWIVWYRCGGGRWHGTGPYTLYHAARVRDAYLARGCEAYYALQ